MNAPECPPAREEVFPLRRLEPALKNGGITGGIEIAYEFFAQRLQDAGNRHQDRDALMANGVDHFRGIERTLKNNCAGQQRREKDSEELAKIMTKREKIQKTNGMNPALLLEVLSKFTLEREKVGKHVGMGNHDAARFGRCSRGEDDLKWIAALD